MALLDSKAFLTDLFQSAVARADPMLCVPAHLPSRPAGRLVVIGAGKASARMAEAVEAAYGPCEGLVITRYGYARPCQGIEIVEAAHPVPDQAGVDATRRMLDLCATLGPDDQVIALISGGGSSLLCAPVPGVTLADKQALNTALLASGMPISGMNVVRKQVSAVKGGRLAAACAPAHVLSLVLSDVPGDDLSEIASGPTVGSRATPQEALSLINQWQVVVPDHMRAVIKAAQAPIGPDDPRLAKSRAVIVAAPAQSLAAAANSARNSDIEVRQLGDALEGEARDLGQRHAALAIEIAAGAMTRPVLLLSGGECTVTRRGDGVGGPNAEYALSAAINLNSHPKISLIACDTDGVDGAAAVAGAYVGPDSLQRAAVLGLCATDALARNDAHTFFGVLGDQIVTGPTLTNVNDFRVILIQP